MSCLGCSAGSRSSPLRGKGVGVEGFSPLPHLRKQLTTTKSASQERSLQLELPGGARPLCWVLAECCPRRGRPRCLFPAPEGAVEGHRDVCLARCFCSWVGGKPWGQAGPARGASDDGRQKDALDCPSGKKSPTQTNKLQDKKRQPWGCKHCCPAALRWCRDVGLLTGPEKPECQERTAVTWVFRVFAADNVLHVCGAFLCQCNS